MTLFEQAATFLDAEGWDVSRLAKGPSSIVGSREELGGIRYFTVWCPSAEEMQHLRQWEPAALRRFAEDAHSPGDKVLLLDSQAGLSRTFRDQLTASNVTLRAPIQFFDRTFCWDDSAPKRRRAASVAAQLMRTGAQTARERVRQPYEDAEGNHGEDLLEDLARRCESTVEWDRPIVLVTAPAGYGKTWFFQALFSRLHEHFQSAKHRHERARRPLPLLPEHVTRAGSTALSSLVEEFLQTDVASPMARATFEWMLTNGYGFWMLDGLDEVIARDPQFFEYLDEIILGADKVVVPRVLICVRDSLLSTSESLRTLTNDGDGLVRGFRLLPWKRESVATFARMRLTKERDWKMMAWLDRKPDILTLCGTPYYAELVAGRVKADAPGLALADLPETELVGDALRQILRREYDKKLINADRFSIDELWYAVGEAARLQMESAPRGIDVRHYAEDILAVLVSQLDPADQELVSGQVLKLSVFTQASEQGRIRFTHDIIHEFLVGEYLRAYFGSQPALLLDLMNCQELAPDSIAMRMLSEYIDLRVASDDLAVLLLRARTSGQGVAFRNLLGVAVQLRDAAGVLADAPLDEQNLSGLTFAGLELAGVSMRGSNLESTTFDHCDLTGLDLSEALLSDTRFNGCRSTMHAATYGSLKGLASVVVDGHHRLETPREFLQLLRRTGRRAGATVDPCPHAVQLRGMFGAFLFPDGRRRRTRVRRNVLVKGSATDAASLLNGAIRSGFISRVQGRGLYECAKGAPYKAMVGFANNLETTPEIVALLDAHCPIKGCGHIGL